MKMSAKRVVELTCGDPKTNQQTASKAACNINISNVVKGGEKPSVTIKDETDYFDETVTHSTEQAQTKRSARDLPVTGSVSSLYVSRQILPEEIQTPKTTEGFIQTASRLTITEAEIVSSIAIKDLVLKAFSNLLTNNDTALVSNLAVAANAADRKVVLLFEDLRDIIAGVVRLVEPEFKSEDVKIKVAINDIEIGCCGAKTKTFVNPINEIVSINIGSQDLKIHQYDAYHAIEDKLGISLQFVYSITKDKEINGETQV